MRYISFHQLREEFGIGYTREHLDRLMKAKKFPQKVHLGSKKGTAVRWPEDEIIEWQEKRAEERSASSF
jgi:predicted DNA-binding transcriptional regulator AlpA